MIDFVHDNFELLLTLLMVGVAVRLGLLADWSVTTNEVLISGASALVALLVVGVWHRATRRKN